MAEMADQSQNRTPLDEAFISGILILVHGGSGRPLDLQTRTWWEDFFNEHQDERPIQLAAIVANRQATGRLPPQATNDPRVQEMINRGGYDLARSVDGPAAPPPIPPPETDPSPGVEPEPNRQQRSLITPDPTGPGRLSTGAGGLATPFTSGTGDGPDPSAGDDGQTANPEGTAGGPTGDAGGPGQSGPDTPMTTPGDSSDAEQVGDVFGTFPEGTIVPEPSPTRAPFRAPNTTAPDNTAPDNTAPGSTAPPPRADLADLSTSHSWRGQSQPPVGVRAQQVLNWARDEDADRRRDFAREWREARAWVDDQLRRGDLGDGTRRLLQQAGDALQVHDRFEDRHRRRLARLTVPDPAAMPRYRPRLNYRAEHPLQLGVWGPGSRASTVLSRAVRDGDRTRHMVNTMWKTPVEREQAFDPTLDALQPVHLEALARAEDALWEGQPDADNLARRENESYEGCVRFDNVGFQGWTDFQSADGGETWDRRFLWDGTRLQNTAACFASERGCRRAGLQAALRQCPNTENRLVDASSRGTLVLPVDVDDLLTTETVRRQTGLGDGRPLTIPSLPADQMRTTQGKMDPQGYIANMAQFWRTVRVRMAEARRRYMAADGPARGPDAEVDNGDRASYDPDVPLPPESVFGPYVWRGVSPDTQFQQDMLRQMRGLKRLFDRERRIAPRPLLAEMELWYQRGHARDRPPAWFAPRDVHPANRTVRGLDPVEVEWLRFLLNQSMTAGMVEDLQPRTTLFLAFAERLARVFADPGDALFPTRDASVTVEQLIDHMAQMKGPAERVVFYPYDVKRWLERLHVQGRCRYAEDFRSYGRVRRPLPTHFPEQLVVWRERTDAEVDFEAHPEDMVYAPRFDDDCRAWGDVVRPAEASASGEDPAPAPLDENVARYFHCLAYRWGHAVRTLAPKERRPPAGASATTWLTQPPLDFARMQQALTALEGRFRDATGWDDAAGGGAGTRALPLGAVEDTPLVEVMQRTLGRPWLGAGAGGGDGGGDGTVVTRPRVRTDEALAAIRAGIIDECVRNDGVLFPGRTADYADPRARRSRGPVWDWARPAVRGRAARRFFALDRWPRALVGGGGGGGDGDGGEGEGEGEDDVVDPAQQQPWDVFVEDPTPWTYWRPKARPYAAQTFKFHEGHRTFQVGDTARQKEVVKNAIVNAVGSSMLGLPDGKAAGGDDRRGLFQRLKSALGLKRPRPRPDDDEDGDDGADDVHRAPKLPRVDRGRVAPSHDPVGEARRAARARARAQARARAAAEHAAARARAEGAASGQGLIPRRDAAADGRGVDSSSNNNNLRMEANVPMG